MSNGKKIIVLGSFAESLINFRGVLLRSMVDSGHHVIACAPHAPRTIREALAGIGVYYYNVPFDRTGTTPLRDIRTLWTLVQLFRKEKPDVVLAYTIKPVAYGSLAARIVGIRSVYSIITGAGNICVTSGLKAEFLGYIMHRLYGLVLRYNKGIFFQNSDDCEYFKRSGLISEQSQTIIINGSGVDLGYFQFSPIESSTSFLLIARLLRDKGIVEFVEASRIIKKKYTEVCCKLVGWFEEKSTSIQQSELESWIADGTIQYMGKLDDVRPAIANSSVYVLPSYREGTPRSVLEAMAMGRPIITTDVPGCRDTVIDGVNGFIVPVKNSQALADAMEKFILEPELIEKMGKRSRKIAEEKYDVRKVNAVIMKEIEVA